MIILDEYVKYILNLLDLFGKIVKNIFSFLQPPVKDPKTKDILATVGNDRQVDLSVKGHKATVANFSQFLLAPLFNYVLHQSEQFYGRFIEKVVLIFS